MRIETEGSSGICGVRELDGEEYYRLVNSEREDKRMVRTANLKDLDQINNLRKQVNDIHVEHRPDIFKPGFCQELQDHAMEMIEAADKEILVCERDGIICGILCAEYIHRKESPYQKEHCFYHIEEIVVDEKYRRQGVGTELMEFAKSEAKRLGMPRVVLDVWAFNDDALAFYERVGMHVFRRWLEMEV